MEKNNSSSTNSAAIVLIIGKPGAWKSTLAKAIRETTWFDILNTLTLRREKIEEGISSTGFETDERYQGNSAQVLTDKIRDRIKRLKPERGMIIEWVWKTNDRRQEIVRSAKENNRPILVIEVWTTYEVRVQRVLSRKLKWDLVEHTNEKRVLDEYEGSFDPVELEESVNL